MANVFTNLAVPAGDGVGASVDMSGYGKVRTITVQGTFESTITIEFSQDNAIFYPIVSFGMSGRKTIDLAGRYMRVRQSGYVQGTANVDVGADDAGGDYVALVAPAGDGVGAAVDVSAFGTFNTVVVSGTYTGTVIIEISEDNTVWAQKMSFSAPGGWQNSVFVARWMRVRRVGTDWQLPGTATVHVGAINDPSSFVGWPGGATTFVLRPGGVAADNVYTDWATLYADLIAVDGLRQVLFDDTLGAISLPAGTYDMQGVRWMGEAEYGATGPAEQVVIGLAEGCILNNLRDFYGPMIVNVNGGATAPCQDLSDNDLVVLRGGVVLNSTTGIPMYVTTNMGAGEEASFFLDQNCQIGGPDTENVIDIDNVGTTIRFHLGMGARINSEALNNPVGSTFIFDYRSTDSQVDLYQPEGLGTLTDASFEKHRYEVTAVKTGAYDAELNEIVRCDANGGTFVVTLPPIATTALAAPIRTYGGHIIVKEEDGTTEVTVDGTAADTIDGGAGAVTVPPGGALMFVSDGVSDWKTVAINRETMLNQVNNYTADQGSAAVDLVDEADFDTDCTAGNYFRNTVTADRNMAAPTGMIAGHTYMWRFVSSGAGRVITFPASFKWSTGTALVTGSSGAGCVDIVTAAYNGTDFDCVGQPDMQ